MSEEATDVLVAAYKTLDNARNDFEELVKRVQDKTVTTEGVILVEREL